MTALKAPRPTLHKITSDPRGDPDVEPEPDPEPDPEPEPLVLLDPLPPLPAVPPAVVEFALPELPLDTVDASLLSAAKPTAGGLYRNEL